MTEDKQERLITLTTAELMNLTQHQVTQENLNDTRKELDGKISDLSNKMDTKINDLSNKIDTKIDSMFYKLVFLMLGTVGSLFGGMIYVLNNFYHLQP